MLRITNRDVVKPLVIVFPSWRNNDRDICCRCGSKTFSRGTMAIYNPPISTSFDLCRFQNRVPQIGFENRE